MKSAPLTIYLADLTHTGIRIANEPSRSTSGCWRPTPRKNSEPPSG